MNIDVLSALQNVAAGSGFAVIDNLGLLVSRIVRLFLIAGTMAAFVYFVWGGLQWIMSGSDKGKLEEAQSRIQNAIIGLVVVVVSWAIFLIINFFFGLNLVDGTGGNTTSTTSNTSTTGTIPSGWCQCGNGQCIQANQKGPLSLQDPTCYTCQTNGGWTRNANDRSCTSPLNCVPCP